MASSLSAEEKYHLITRGLQEVLGAESIKALLDQGKTPKCYWGLYASSSLLGSNGCIYEVVFIVCQVPHLLDDVSFQAIFSSFSMRSSPTYVGRIYSTCWVLRPIDKNRRLSEGGC